METWLTQRFGLSVPLVAAPMAGAGGGRFAAAVSTAGGLGMIGASVTTPAWVTEQCGVAAAAGRPYGVGLLAWVLEQDTSSLEAVLAVAPVPPSLVSVSYGDYAPYVEILQAAGITVATQVGTLDEARTAEQAGVDVIVSRGGEGGGHGRDDVATLPLLQMVLETVRTPVLAAGGIVNARGLAAVLAAGAAGAWVGTAFLTCAETQTVPAARERLVAAADTGTAYGRVFDLGHRLAWPSQYGGRALRNAYFDRWHGKEDELMADDAAAQELDDARQKQNFDTAAIYAGQGVGALDRVRLAADVVEDFAAAGELLRRASR